MKKRILSMLLLVVMLVTALPLAVLPSLATEEEKAPTFTEEEYNALYAAQDAALISLDFFKTNEWWGKTVALPTPCEEIDGYEYNGKTYNFKSNPSDRFHTAEEKWAVKRSDGYHVYYTKTGDIECANGVNPAKVLSASIDGQFVAPRQMFATKAEAEAAKALAEAKWTKYTFAIVEIPRYIVWRVELTNNNQTWAYGKNASGADTWNTANGTIGFMTEELAAAKAKALAGEGAVEADGGYKSANGKYLYYADVRPMQSNEYRQVQDDYIAKSNEIFSSFHIGPTKNTVAANQQLLTIGEINYQTTVGEHFYSHVLYENGTMTLNPHHGSPYFTMRDIPHTGDLYVDMLLAGGAKSNVGSDLFAIRGVKFRFGINGDGTKLVKLVNHSAGIPEVAATEKLVAGRDTIFRFELSSTATASTITMNTFIDGTEVIDNTALTFDGKGDGLIAHSQTSAARFYTYRIYNRTLTAAEKAQNHFADLMKWFKMDLSPLRHVDEADMPVIHAALAGYTLNSDRDAVYDALLQAATDIVLPQHSDISPVYMALAVKYGLDVSFLENLPKSYLPTTYAYLDSVTASSVNVKAGYDAAVSADIALIVAGSTLSYTDYNELYVQDDLKTAIDYFATNSIWGQEKKSSARDETYIWKWSYLNANGKRTGIYLPEDLPISGGALHLTGNTNLGETHKANNYSYDGMTTEYVFADDRAGKGTFFNIDDLRISTAVSGTRISFGVVGQRTNGEEGKLRIPEVTTFSHNKIDYTTYKEFRTTAGFDFDTAVRTFVVRTKTPTHSIDYYAYSYNNVAAAYAAEGKTLYVPDSIPSTTYFLVTHDENGNKLAAPIQTQFAFYKPIYTEIGNNVYITGSTFRAADKGIGLGENGLDFFHDEYGSFSMRLDGELLFSADKLIWPDNKGITGGTYFMYGCNGTDGKSINRDVYAYRSYARQLSDDELAQNHFVDIAKFYKLNVSGLSALSDAAKATVYASVADMRIGEVAREVAQLAVTSAIHSEMLKLYETLKGEDAKINAFIDLAAEYYVDMDLLEKILESDRDVSSLYEMTFAGSRAEVPALVEEAYHDAYYFLSYQTKGYPEWNAWLGAVAAADTVDNIEALMILPRNVRTGIAKVEDNTDAAVIDAFITEKLALYNDISRMSEADYNALYVKDGLLMGADFYKMNEYWNTDGKVYALPIGPSENDAFYYDTDGDGVEEKHDLTTEAGRNTVVNNEADKTNNGKTLFTVAQAKWRIEYPAFMNDNFLWTSKTGMRFTYYNNSRFFTQEFAPFVIADGHVKFRKDYATSGGLTFTGVKNTTAATMQMVASFDGTRDSWTPFLWHHIKVTYKLDGDTVAYKSVSDHVVGNFKNMTAYEGVFAEKDKVYPYTQSVKLNDGDDDFYAATQLGIMAEGKAPYKTKTDGSSPAANLTNGDFHMGWGTPAISNTKLYAFREYNRVLEQSEILLNHFVDLAKWYRIDISDYLKLDNTERAAIHEAMKGYTIDTEDRAGIIKAYYTALTDNYSAAEGVLSPDMLAVARELGLDVSALLTADPAVRAYVEAAVLADFKAGQPMLRKVVQAVIDDTLVYKTAFAFEGVQVRLQSASGDLPGVRAIFSANKNVINAYAASGKDVAFGVEICDASGKALAELRFTAKDGVYAGTNTVLASGKTSDAVIREVGENSLAFAYTVTFGEGAQSAAYYETEFGYRFFVEVDGLRNIVEAVRSDAFDATVCAAEAYRYFYENGYADDRVVSAVIAALGE